MATDCLRKKVLIVCDIVHFNVHCNGIDVILCLLERTFLWALVLNYSFKGIISVVNCTRSATSTTLAPATDFSHFATVNLCTVHEWGTIARQWNHLRTLKVNLLTVTIPVRTSYSSRDSSSLLRNISIHKNNVEKRNKNEGKFLIITNIKHYFLVSTHPYSTGISGVYMQYIANVDCVYFINSKYVLWYFENVRRMFPCLL